MVAKYPKSKTAKKEIDQLQYAGWGTKTYMDEAIRRRREYESDRPETK